MIGADQLGSDWNQFRFFAWSRSSCCCCSSCLPAAHKQIKCFKAENCSLSPKAKIQSSEDFYDRLLSLFIVCRLSLKTEMFESTVKFRLLCIAGHKNNGFHLRLPLTEPSVFFWMRSRLGEGLTGRKGSVSSGSWQEGGGCRTKPNHGYNCLL